MTKETILSLLRTLLTTAGAFLVGKHLLGQTIDSAVWEGWVGLIVGLGSTIWGIVDKSATIEMIQSGLRSAVMFIGGIFVAKGTLSSDTLTSILGLGAAVVSFVYSILSRQKTAAIKAAAPEAPNPYLAKLKAA